MSIRVDVQMDHESESMRYVVLCQNSAEGVIFSSMMTSSCTVWSMRNGGLAA